MSPANLRALAASAAILILAPCAAAQDSGLDPNFTAQKVYLHGMEIRAPAEMNTNERRLIGMEEAGVKFRENTPALIGTFDAKHVADDEAYRRRLAMYEHAAPIGEVSVPQPDGNGSEATTPPPVGNAEPEMAGGRSSVGWLLLLAGVVMVGVVLFALRGVRRAGSDT